MKGLIIKDIKLLFNQKSSLFIFLMLGIFFTVSSENISGAVAYIVMMLSIFTLNTISYDSHDNGMAFLLCLPVSKKEYVMSKYAMMMSVSLIACVLVTVFGIVVTLVKGGNADLVETLAVSGGVLVAIWMVIVWLIPIYLKWGAEKGSIALMVIFGIIAGIAFILSKITAVEDILINLVEAIGSMHPVQICIGIVVLIVLMFTMSMLVSFKVMEKKEY